MTSTLESVRTRVVLAALAAAVAVYAALPTGAMAAPGDPPTVDYEVAKDGAMDQLTAALAPALVIFGVVFGIGLGIKLFGKIGKKS